MIQRIRRPDGTKRDIDHGPGPVGPSRKSHVGGYRVSDAPRMSSGSYAIAKSQALVK